MKCKPRTLCNGLIWNFDLFKMKPVRKALKMAPLTLYLSFGIEVNAFNGLLTHFFSCHGKT
ncbi:hypothetical protein BDZ85DRAFT_259399 [Elsinoe ampelina]|uniref:Uncharacterized protein n=1 Tax=Elsinoe ampelina TaxID=302913 RepID=A0A6A6GGU9_9PEZI|nr:hypothetical protein BDZ85DRAFT_259399 [Elsinoe ampelina]